MARPPLHCIMHASHATDAFDETMLSPIIEHARRANAARGITGVLLYGQGNFFQVLEGEAPLLTKLLVKLNKDARHDGSQVLFQGTIEQRSFRDSCMELIRLPEERFLSPEHYQAFLRENDLELPPLTDTLTQVWSLQSECEQLTGKVRATG